MKIIIDVLDASSRKSLLETFDKVFGINETDLSDINKYHNEIDVYWYEAIENLFNIEIKNIEINKVLLHHVTNIYNIELIKKEGLRGLKDLIQNKSTIRDFLHNHNISIDMNINKIFYCGKEVSVLDNLNIMNRIKNEPYIHAFLFKEDLYSENNYYTGLNSGILREAPEFVLELDKQFQLSLLDESKKLENRPYIISFEIPTYKIWSWDNKEIIGDLMEWLCTGRSLHSNDIELRGIERVYPNMIKNIEKLL